MAYELLEELAAFIIYFQLWYCMASSVSYSRALLSDERHL